ncbi:uncharacterized protein LOC141644222 [Silene latifolia]|uniref:uncharacterized protein LOC141644222 n=1 Tax=Silene latifolia TaxID=37657 RepID=UPI003D77D39A
MSVLTIKIMNPSHKECGHECLMCKLEWYNGSSEDEQEDEIEDSAPDSPPPNIVVPDSLDPEDLGTQVMETEFDDGFVWLSTSPENDDRPKSPDIPLADGLGCRSGAPDDRPKSESSCTKYANAYLKRMAAKRAKTPVKKPPAVEYVEDHSPSPSSKRLKAYCDVSIC